MFWYCLNYHFFCTDTIMRINREIELKQFLTTSLVPVPGINSMEY